MINTITAIALIVLVLSRLPAATNRAAARPAWIASALGLLGLLSIGVLIPIPIADSWLGGSNVLFLFRTLFPVAAFWFLRDAVALQAGRPPRRRRMLLVLLGMVLMQSAAFFVIPERGSTNLEFVDHHMVYAAGLVWAVVYVGQLMWISVDIMVILRAVPDRLFLTFRLGGVGIVIGGASLLTHCVLIFVGTIKPVADDPAWLLFNAFFYPGILLVTLGFVALVLRETIPATLWSFRARYLRRLLSAYALSPTRLDQGIVTNDPLQETYESSIALRNSQVVSGFQLAASDARRLRTIEGLLDKKLGDLS